MVSEARGLMLENIGQNVGVGGSFSMSEKQHQCQRIFLKFSRLSS